MCGREKLEFWCKYIRGNDIERYTLVEQLYDKILSKIVNEKYKHTIISLLVSYFDDLIEVLTEHVHECKNIDRHEMNK